MLDDIIWLPFSMAFLMFLFIELQRRSNCAIGYHWNSNPIFKLACPNLHSIRIYLAWLLWTRRVERHKPTVAQPYHQQKSILISNSMVCIEILSAPNKQAPLQMICHTITIWFIKLTIVHPGRSSTTAAPAEKTYKFESVPITRKCYPNKLRWCIICAAISAI